MELKNMGKAKSLYEQLLWINGPIRIVDAEGEFDNSNKYWVISGADGESYYIAPMTKSEVLTVLKGRKEKILTELKELGVEV